MKSKGEGGTFPSSLESKHSARLFLQLGSLCTMLSVVPSMGCMQVITQSTLCKHCFSIPGLTSHAFTTSSGPRTAKSPRSAESCAEVHYAGGENKYE